MDDSDLEDQVREVMLDLMSVLFTHGIKRIHMGALMRLMGVSEHTAREHDNETIELDENFAQMLTELNNLRSVPVPAGTTFH